MRANRDPVAPSEFDADHEILHRGTPGAYTAEELARAIRATDSTDPGAIADPRFSDERR